MIIQNMVKEKLPNNNKPRDIIERTKAIMNSLSFVHFYYIPKRHNNEVDRLPNEGSNL